MIIYKTTGEVYEPTSTVPVSWNLYAPTTTNPGNGTQSRGSNDSLATSAINGNTFTSALGTGFIWYFPVIFGKTRVLSKLGLVVANVAGAATFGIYDSAQSTSTLYTTRVWPLPDLLIGTTTTATVLNLGAFEQPLVTPVTIEANRVYWVAYETTSAALQFMAQGTPRMFGANTSTSYNVSYRTTYAYAPLPASAKSGTLSPVASTSSPVPAFVFGWQ